MKHVNGRVSSQSERIPQASAFTSERKRLKRRRRDVAALLLLVPTPLYVGGEETTGALHFLALATAHVSMGRNRGHALVSYLPAPPSPVRRVHMPSVLLRTLYSAVHDTQQHVPTTLLSLERRPAFAFYHVCRRGRLSALSFSILPVWRQVGLPSGAGGVEACGFCCVAYHYTIPVCCPVTCHPLFTSGYRAVVPYWGDLLHSH